MLVEVLMLLAQQNVEREDRVREANLAKMIRVEGITGMERWGYRAGYQRAAWRQLFWMAAVELFDRRTSVVRFDYLIKKIQEKTLTGE